MVEAIREIATPLGAGLGLSTLAFLLCMVGLTHAIRSGHRFEARIVAAATALVGLSLALRSLYHFGAI